MSEKSPARSAAVRHTVVFAVTLLSCSSGDVPRGDHATAAQPVTAAAGAPLPATDGPTTVATPIGLALDVDNGTGTPLHVRAGQTFYLDQIDLRASTTATVDEGVDALARAGDFASLDWRGVALRDQEFVASPNPDGTRTRRRFYRGARWMEGSSVLTVQQLDAAGNPTAPPWVARVGEGDDRRAGDSFFVRRLRALQYTHDCASETDCTTASRFTEEALVELRHAPRAHPAIAFDPATTQLRVRWSALRDGGHTYTIPVTQVAAPAFDYNFRVEVAALTPPGAGGVYPPGARIDFRVSYLDGAGARLHPVGSLPTYLETVTTNRTGLQYVDLAEPVATYWRRKHREHQMFASITGPAQNVQPIRSPLGLPDFFAPDGIIGVGQLARDGVFAQAWFFPRVTDLFSGNVTAPVSDVFTFQLPADAPAGTYLVTVKARRNYLGQEVPRSRTIEIQVGSPERTVATLGTGPCNSCHQGGSALDRVLHGSDNRATCATCHAPLTVEPEGPIAVRLHFIHSRSGRLDAPLERCAMCHVNGASIQRTSQAACLSCHTSYPPDHVARFGPVTSAYVGGPLATAFQQCTDACHTTHPRSGL